MTRLACLTLAAVLVTPAAALADPALALRAHFFNEDDAELEKDLFAAAAAPSIGQADQGPWSGELMLVVTVADGGGKDATVTVKQKRMKTVKRKLPASGIAFDKWSAPLLVPYQACDPMEITVAVGKTKLVKTIDFVCGE